MLTEIRKADMTAEAAVPVRRALRFETFDQVLAEAERCAGCRHRLLGKWSYGQILDHLAQAIDCFYGGFGFQAPWFLRTILAPLVKRRVLTKGMPAGFRLPAAANRLLPHEEVTTDEGLKHLHTSLSRLKREDPTHPHPFLGQLTPFEIRLLMLRHAELHLSFVVPEEDFP